MKRKRLVLLFFMLALLVLSACSDSSDIDSSDIDSYEDTNDTGNTSSPYTEDELINDPLAPSTNPNDYNSNGEYVPENGPSDNPADYNVDGEYKPIEDMTEEEKRAELERFFNGE